MKIRRCKCCGHMVLDYSQQTDDETHRARELAASVVWWSMIVLYAVAAGLGIWVFINVPGYPPRP